MRSTQYARPTSERARDRWYERSLRSPLTSPTTDTNKLGAGTLLLSTFRQVLDSYSGQLEGIQAPLLVERAGGIVGHRAGLTGCVSNVAWCAPTACTRWSRPRPITRSRGGYVATRGRSGAQADCPAWLTSRCSVVKVLLCTMIASYAGVAVWVAVHPRRRTHSLRYAASYDLQRELIRTNAYPP